MPDGNPDAARVTVPEKPLRLARLIADVPGEPDGRERLAGVPVILKSPTGSTATDKAVEWESEPLVPVTITV